MARCRHLHRFINYIAQWMKPKSLPDALRIMVISLYWTGLPPYRVTPIPNGRRYSKLCIVGRIIGFYYLLSFVISYILTIQEPIIFTSYFNDDPIFRVADGILITACMLAMVLVFLAPIWQRYGFLDQLQCLIQIDTRLERLGICQNHVATMLHIVKRMILCAILYGLYAGGSYTLFSFLQHATSPNTWISYFSAHHILSQLVFKYLTMTNLIRVRYVHMNGVSYDDKKRFFESIILQ